MAAISLDELRDVIDARRTDHGVPGAAVGVAHHGRSELATFGIANVDTRVPVSPETVFQIGSITKTFTAAALFRLVEQGAIELDVPVRTYLPDLRLADDAASRTVTLRHLLSHRGGL